jgi:hypothetical protein
MALPKDKLIKFWLNLDEKWMETLPEHYKIHEICYSIDMEIHAEKPILCRSFGFWNFLKDK